MKKVPIAYDARIKVGGKFVTINGLDGPPKQIRTRYGKREIKWIRASLWKFETQPTKEI